jgi:conjugative transfer region protein TrbK
MPQPRRRRASASRASVVIEMGPLAKIAIGGGVSGLMLAIAFGVALRLPPRRAELPGVRSNPSGPSDPTPARCQTITTPDSGCTSAWEARRRHFFGEGAAR